jgi:hypothetical protein
MFSCFLAELVDSIKSYELREGSSHRSKSGKNRSYMKILILPVMCPWLWGFLNNCTQTDCSLTGPRNLRSAKLSNFAYPAQYDIRTNFCPRSFQHKN